MSCLRCSKMAATTYEIAHTACTPCVLAGRDWLQVQDVDTPRVTAEMVQMLASGDWTYPHLVRELVGGNDAVFRWVPDTPVPLFDAIPSPDEAVSVSV